MRINRILHLFHESGAIFHRAGWEIHCHSREKMEATLASRDRVEATEFAKKFTHLKDSSEREEFYKYVTLYYFGGIFTRYFSEHEIDFADIDTLIGYCQDREISLFHCPSVTAVGFVHHPQLLELVSSDLFHPLSQIYKGPSMGHKTLVTSLPLGAYVKKIPPSLLNQTGILAGVGVGAFILGYLFGSAK